MIEGQRVAVTGGAGFMGSHVVAKLLEAGNRVAVLDDFSNGKRWHLAPLEGPSLDIVPGDVTRADDVAAVFEGAEVVVHLAVLGLRQSIKQPALVSRVIVDGTLTCLQAARDAGVSLFVNCSSSEVFGTAVTTPMDEQHPRNPETPYAAAKAAQDMYVASFGRTFGLPWTTVRPFNMYGPKSHWQGMRGEVIPKMIVRALNKQPLVVFGDGGQTRDFVYVADAVEALLAVAAAPDCRGEEVNAGSGSEIAIARVAEMICEHLGLDAEKLIEHQPARPGDVRRHLADVTKLESLTGYRPRTSFAAGLGTTIDWFRSLPYTPAELLADEALRAWE